MYLCVMKDVLFESSMPKYWRISTSTGERTSSGDYGYATVWVPYNTASDARLTASSPTSCFGRYLVPVSDDENVTISFSRTSKTQIFC